MEVWGRLKEEIGRKNIGAKIDMPDFSLFFNCTPKEAFTRTLLSYAQMINKKIPGVKCPGNEFYYEIIREWLDGFQIKFIHLVRNPFDMVASFQNSSYYRDAIKQNPDNIEVHSRNWCRSVSLALCRSHYYPQEYYYLKYEDLAQNPAKETKALCDFIGVEFAEKKMLEAEDFDYYGSNTSFGSQKRADGKNFIKPPKSRKNFLLGSQIQIIKSICGELAHAIGYKDQDFFPKAPEPLKSRKPPAIQTLLKMTRRFAEKLDELGG
jgi:hypothetical protein